jgi:co-chaperonin GroES (HSP10)
MSTAMKMKMKNDYILTQEIKQTERKTESGLIIPGETYNRHALVVEVANGLEVKKGDKIIKTIGKGTEYTFEGDKFEILHINHILAVIEENGTETTST